MAFRGEQVGVGISERYRRLEPEIARSFLYIALDHINGSNADPEQIAEAMSFAQLVEPVPTQPLNPNARDLASRTN